LSEKNATVNIVEEVEAEDNSSTTANNQTSVNDVS
jgi:hypothetical protein